MHVFFYTYLEHHFHFLHIATSHKVFCVHLGNSYLQIGMFEYVAESKGWWYKKRANFFPTFLVPWRERFETKGFYFLEYNGISINIIHAVSKGVVVL